MAKKITLADIAKILKKDKTKGDTSYWGVVQSVNTTDGKVTSYNVSLGGDAGTVKCRKLAGAKVNDTVLVTLRSTGEAIVVGTKNGDTDASDAQTTANTAQGTADGVATNLNNNYYTKTQTEQKIGELGGGQAVYSATCTTGASTTAKVATCSGFTLKEGAIVNVSFTYANTAANPTLNVNGTGAKAIQLNGSAITSSYYWKAGKAVQFYYNGTAWQLLLSAYFSDLTALSAAIGGMSIQNGAIYSGSHSDIIDGNDGSYLGTDGVSYVGTYNGNKVRALISRPTSEVDEVIEVCTYNNSEYYWNEPVFAVTKTGALRVEGYELDDFVTEQGTSSNWNYRKWKSGKKECWRTVTQSITKAGGSGPYYGNGSTVSFPSSFFSSAPMVQMSNSGSADGWLGTTSAATSSATGQPRFYRLGSWSGSVSVTLSIYAIGS